MNCDEVRELLAAEALGALAQEEQAQVRAHLDECELHAEAAELRAIALALAEAAPEREPSPELWERIEAAAIGRAESPSEPPTGPSTGPPAGPSTGSTGLPFWLRYGLAAALGAIAVGLVALVATLATSGDASGDEAGSETFVLVYRGGGAYLRAERTAGASQVVLVLAGLDRLPPEQTYGSVRFGLSRETTDDEVGRAVRIVVDVVTRLREPLAVQRP